MNDDLKESILFYLSGAPDVGAFIPWLMEDFAHMADSPTIAEALLDLAGEDKIFKGPGGRVYPVMVGHE